MHCPSVETLERLLASDAAGNWRNHIDECERCRSVLDRVADDPELRSWRPAVDQPTTPGPGLRRVLADWNTSRLGALDDSTGAALPFLDAPRRSSDIGSLGPYEIECELGRGGMSVVFRGHDPSLNRTVAIKVLRPAADDANSRSRLVREAKALAKLKHANIVQVHAIAETATGLPYLVLEYVAGPSLADHLRDGGSLPPRVAAALIAAIADGLQLAHEEGLIHRDVKSANILLAKSDIPKLTDFGLVRGAEATVTTAGMLAGTPAYMSPEQVRDPGRVDARTDIYALGATLYECLTGDVPFHGSTAMVLRQVLDDEPRAPRHLNDTIPRDLEVICMKALSKEPGRRYATAADLASDLQRYLAGKPITARPAGRAERLVRWSRRQPVVASLSCALVVVALVGIGGIVWQWRVAVAETAEARIQRADAEENLRAAVSVVDQFLTRVSEDQLAQTPGFEPLRRKLLEDALVYYERFLTRPSAAPGLRTETARAAVRAAHLSDMLRPPPDRVAAWDRAIASWNRCDDEPDRLDQMLQCRLNRALSFSAGGQLDECAEALTSLRRELTERGAAEPEKKLYRHLLGTVLGTLGNVHSRAERTSEALAAHAAAQRVFEELIAQHPEIENADYLRRLALCINNRAMLLEPATALALYEQSRAMQVRAVAASKNSPAEIRMLARFDQYRGSALAELGRGPEAQVVLADACTALRKLIGSQPAVRDNRRSFAEAIDALGQVQAEANLPDAAESFSQARAEFERLLADDPQSAPLQQALSEVVANQERFRQKVCSPGREK